MSKFDVRNIVLLQNDDFDKLPYNPNDSAGIAIPSKKTAFIRITGNENYDKDTYLHELEELFNPNESHKEIVDGEDIFKKKWYQYIPGGQEVRDILSPVIDPVSNVIKTVSEPVEDIFKMMWGEDWAKDIVNTGSDVLGLGGDGGGLNDILKLILGGYGAYSTAESQEDYMNWLERLYQPQLEYQQEQTNLLRDVYSPLTKQLGGELGEAFSLSDETSEAYWGKGREKIEDYYGDVEQRASELFAGSGMIGQGPANQYFSQTLPGMKAKSMEDLVSDQVLWESSQKQQNIGNLLNFLGKSPTVSGYETPQYTGLGVNWASTLKDLISV